MKPQAVVFDIGNVLIHWDPLPVYDRLIGPARRQVLFDAVDLFDMNRRVDLGEPFAALVRATADAHPDWRDEIMLWQKHWMEMASPAIDHSVRLMQALQTKGIPVFSLTNFGIETYELAAGHYPFMRAFDRDFISGHLKMIKPDPAIFAHVEDTSGIDPAALLFTDDSAANIAAAAKRGWQTHLFDGPEGWADRLVKEELLTKEEAH
ncbi:Alpha-D-glucose-1-phosphate phosphatase YihX [Sulfitobacter sp. THAF37]|uniref:HAD-IA family hydrolase n=1 Tax=Sulfitobacter sp. THAF37 TaxID=2587855 RepID=UPI0012695EDA|nr:HAD-IA family hydrolase [Sulfitobacter sp. THAF37]QFT58458.1 Alpha-D-glucose-1-phosphate phosphatase YihX [Sulfitobacter sp. THAF37]